jgi:hypothetical protein
MYVQRNIEARSRNCCCHGKAINVTCSECVSVVLVIQHAKRMRHVILSSVSCPTLPYFFRIISEAGRILGNFIERQMCVLVFSRNFG